MPTAASITEVRKVAAKAVELRAYAKHGDGYCRFSGGSIPTTFLFSDEACTQPLGWQRGLLDDGSVWVGDISTPYRVMLVGAAQARKAA